jgi:hypothetical protein
MLATSSPLPLYPDLDGSPLDAGSIYFGTANQNPETSPITVYWDSAGTQPAAQPVRTLNGFPMRSGTPGQIYASGDYSLTVRNSAGRQVLYAPSASAASGALALSLDLANSIDPTKGSALPAFNGQLNYAASTIGWADQLHGMQLEWFYQAADGVDYSPSFNRACAALLLLTGAPYQDSLAQGNFGYGVSRRLNLAGKKYLTNSPLVFPVAGGGQPTDISIYGFGGGFYPGPTFPAGNYILDTGTSPYGGTGLSVTIDGQGQNVKGIIFRNAHYPSWDKLKVVNCANDGIVYAAGAELTLTNFEVSGCITPTAVTVAGLRTQTSDGHFINGVVKYTPIGVKEENGGNNDFVNIHTWGLYAAYRMYVGFYSTNSVRSKHVGCYADSPAKQDYTQDGITILNGIPNGGIGFFFDSTSTQQSTTSCRAFINTTAWAAFAAPWSGATAYTAGPLTLVTSGGVTYQCALGNTNQAPPNATYWTPVATNQFSPIYTAAQFTTTCDLVYNYAGNWIGGVRYDSTTTQNNCLEMGTSAVTNGFIVPRLGQSADSGGSTTGFVVQNTNAGFATSEARMTMKVGAGTDTAAIGGVFGAAGASYMYGAVLGLERWRYSALKYSYTGANVNEGDQSGIWSDGVGSFPMMALYRNNGGGSPNAAFAAAKFGNINSNSRSINAAGTINASGADYAEYMRKAVGCGGIAKGQVVGVDANGQLTDKWSLSIARVVKSTDPSLVGGDKWGTPEVLGVALPVAPREPRCVLPDMPMLELVEPARALPGASDAEVSQLAAQFDEERAAAQARFDTRMQAYRAAEEQLTQAWAAFEVNHAAYLEQMAQLNAASEAARQHVDRIAFCGQVPCNVTGAFAVGDYIVAQQGDDDRIVAVAVAAPTFEQYRDAVGKVVATEPDGRPRIIVKVS